MRIRGGWWPVLVALGPFGCATAEDVADQRSQPFGGTGGVSGVDGAAAATATGGTGAATGGTGASSTGGTGGSTGGTGGTGGAGATGGTTMDAGAGAGGGAGSMGTGGLAGASGSGGAGTGGTGGASTGGTGGSATGGSGGAGTGGTGGAATGGTGGSATGGAGGTGGSAGVSGTGGASGSTGGAAGASGTGGAAGASGAAGMAGACGGAVEVCNGTDDDGDGLVDEPSAQNTAACNGCTAVQRNGFAYWFCTTNRDRSPSATDCSNKGATLASIHDQAENDFVTMTMGTLGVSGRFWIGFRDPSEGNYVWDDGTPFDYSYFNCSSTPISTGGEDCGNITNASGCWDDDDCSGHRFPYLCKAPHDSACP